MTEIVVKTEREYPVLIGKNIINRACGFIRSASDSVFVSDDTVFSLHGAKVLEVLGISQENVFVFPHGEKSKTASVLFSLVSFLAGRGISRNGTVIALGGGVTGDIAGFAASVYMRGISFIQLPTTVLSAADSSVGGKTGINLPEGKNLCGTFYQPDAVICDTAFFETLPDREFTCGMAEVLKCAVISGEAMLCKILEYNKKNDREYTELTDIIADAVRLKAEIVSKDEKDIIGLRAQLNLGHTVGHAIEKLSGESVLHGFAVGAGLAFISACGVSAGICDIEEFKKIVSALDILGLPVKTEYTAAELACAAMNDKKATQNDISLIIPKKIGECTVLTIPKNRLEVFFSAGEKFLREVEG